MWQPFAEDFADSALGVLFFGAGALWEVKNPRVFGWLFFFLGVFWQLRGVGLVFVLVQVFVFFLTFVEFLESFVG